jgi:hypothetical protein
MTILALKVAECKYLRRCCEQHMTAHVWIAQLNEKTPTRR